MALNIGNFFLENGCRILWTTGSLTQKIKLEKHLDKLKRQRALFATGDEEPLNAECYHLSDRNIPKPDIIIESTRESLVEKQKLFSTLAALIDERTMLFSNSSSLLPDLIHPKCLGAHFFFPVILMGFIELIIPPNCSAASQERAIRFFSEYGFDIFLQNSNNGFLVNRLLLPLQAECFKALRDGCPAPLVEQASSSDLISRGQLSLMDNIGLDIIHAAAIEYRSLIDPASLVDHELLISSLEELLLLGKKGKKNKNGLLLGDKLPWPGKRQSRDRFIQLQQRLEIQLQLRCKKALDDNEINPSQLGLVCSRIFQTKGFEQSYFAISDKDRQMGFHLA